MKIGDVTAGFASLWGSQMKGQLKPFLGLLLLAAAVTGLLLVTDLMLLDRGIAVERLFRAKTLWTIFAIMVLVAALPSRKARLWALAFFTLNQVIWTGCGVYFNRALGPEQLLLAQNEVGDTVRGALAEWRSLLPPIGIVLSVGLVAGLLLARDFGGRVLRWRFAGVALIGALVAGSSFWFLHKRIEVAFPGADTPAAYGPLQALVSMLRLQSTKVSAGEGVVIADQAVSPALIGDEPQTVVVIMGESINAYRLSVLGFGKETTPELARWLKEPPAGFTFIPRVGVSGGTATFGSVPSFLRMAYIPVGAETKGLNLFDLANRQSFKNWFLSVQHKQFFDMAGGSEHMELVETVPGALASRYGEVHDDLLVEHARRLPGESGRRFIVFHQNVNHSPYYSHCTHAAEGNYPFKDESGTHQGRRQADYDNGLRCWDRNVAAIVREFLSHKGAVSIFIMADHSELMGEANLWGHGFPDVRASMVPMMLLTNRPDSPAAQMFKSLAPPTTYRMAQTVARALGLEVTTPEISPKRFYLNSTMPFALAGFMEVQSGEGDRFAVTTFARNGRRLNTKSLHLPELTTGRVGEKGPAAEPGPSATSAH